MDLGVYNNHGTALQQCYKSSVLRALQSAVLYMNLHDRNVLNIIIFFSLYRVVIKSGGRGFSPATNRVAPGYFCWKIEEK